MSTARIPDGTPPGRTQPIQLIITFERASLQRAFADWVASGECATRLWEWMSRHGYHA